MHLHHCLSFILNGGSIDDPDYDSRTALHVAASEGNAEALQFLLSRWTASLGMLSPKRLTILNNIYFRNERSIW